MAIIANCSQPQPDLTSINRVLPVINGFPTVPTVLGFCADVIDAVIISWIDGPPITGSLFPESPYLEPTIGQIWPRIG